jgi:hypothetical protein
MAEDEQAGQPEKKETPWYRDPPKLIPVLVGVTVIITFLVAMIPKLIPDPPKDRVEYIVDVSAAMRGKIGKKDKLPAVAAEVLEHVNSRPDTATALRLAGGHGCGSAYEPPVVGFSRDNGDEIADVLGDVSPGGRSNFAHAVTHAADDIDTGGELTTMLIFVGGDDSCSQERSAAIIRQALRDLRNTPNVDVNFKFVGVKVPPRMRRVLNAARREARRLDFGAEVIYAQRPQQLATVVMPSQSPADTPEPTP